jgi:Concanavalin A-like lectin/glucanases superfamily
MMRFLVRTDAMRKGLVLSRLFLIGLASLMLANVASPAAASGRLVGDWKLDEGSGTRAADSSGSGNDGVVSGGAFWVAGRWGAALSFAGTTGAVRVPDSSALEPVSAVSVSAWVKHDRSPGAYRYIVAKGATGCIAASYGLYSGPNGGLEFYVSQSRGTKYARSPDAGTRVWDGNWHLVFGTFDGTTVRLFVDGIQVGAGTQSPGALEYLLPQSNDLFIGDYPGCATHEFLGVIDEVKIWNQALTAAEITAIVPAGDNGGAPSSGVGSRRNGSAFGTGPASPPVISRLRLSPSTITIHTGGRRRRARRPTRATLSYVDTQAARSTFTVLRMAHGVRRGKRCVKRVAYESRRRAISCIRYVHIGSFARNDRAGRTSFRFDGLPRRRLAPARYRLDVTPKAHGMVGRTASARFIVLNRGSVRSASPR